LTRLTRLNIEKNDLARIPTAIRNLSTLTHLSFQSNHITKLQCSDFFNLPMLTELNLNSNKISKLKKCVLKDFPNLANFSAEENYLVLVHKETFNNMLNLTDLNIKSKSATNVENGAFDGLLNLRHLTFSQKYQSGGVISGLGHLERLVVFISTNEQTVVSKPMTFNISSLQELTIEVDRNVCIDQALCNLHNMTNLQVFSLDTFCCYIPSDTFLEAPHLQNVTITNCVEFSPDPDLFKTISELKFLDLSHNKIQNLNFFSTSTLTKLEKLILRNNKLRIINETIFETLPSLKYLDLSENPFACDCSNAGFIIWVIKNKQVQVVNAFQYRCSSPLSLDGQFLLDFKVQLCWEGTRLFCFLFSSGLVLFTLLSSFIYHFMRWRLVYGFYLLQAFLYDSKKKKQESPSVYDAFVSYNVHNEDWVYGELVPELEEQQGWKLCLHHRDFQPGNSKPGYVYICMYLYFRAATVACVEFNDVFCSREHSIPFYQIRKLVRSHTYLSWNQARGSKALFWEKVQRALESGHNPVANPNPHAANL
uniref:TIR domain-containing protein n=1 Tax=Periophthalmus magnuspinnatus TaxID=409849 RepID=A0A3B4BH06_9GOBI